MGEGGRGGQTAKEEKSLYAQDGKKQAEEKGGKFQVKASAITRKLQITGLRADPRLPYQWNNCFTH